MKSNWRILNPLERFNFQQFRSFTLNLPSVYIYKHIHVNLEIDIVKF